MDRVVAVGLRIQATGAGLDPLELGGSLLGVGVDSAVPQVGAQPPLSPESLLSLPDSLLPESLSFLASFL